MATARSTSTATPKPRSRRSATAAASTGAEDDSTQAEPVDRSGEALQEWIHSARALGLPAQQQVWELHVAQGRSLLDTARLLELPLPEVQLHYAEGRRLAAGRAPLSEEERHIHRAEIWDKLQATYAMTCGSSDPRLLTLRLKSVDQMSRLLGLNIEELPPEAADTSPPPYAIGEDTREFLQMQSVDSNWGRAQQVAEVREMLAQSQSASGDLN